MLMVNEVVEMEVREMNRKEFDETYCEEQIIFMDDSFDSIIESLVYNEATHIIDELNNYNPYNNYDIVYIVDEKMFALILEQY